MKDITTSINDADIPSKTLNDENDKSLNNTIREFQNKNIIFSDKNINNNSNFVNSMSKFDNRQISQLLKNKYNRENKIELLVHLAHCNKMGKWPEKTNTACFWCCHKFEGTPWGIPYKYENELFHLFGVFCSPNCCASYIFNENYDSNKKWEQFSLLNMLYYKIFNEMDNITLAPSKLCLKKFGGCLEIDEYRDKFLTNNSYILKFPPMRSIIPIMDEVNKNKFNIKNNSNNNNNFIPIDKNRIKKANTELKLKRSKPIASNKNTLDNCMNINIIA